MWYKVNRSSGTDSDTPPCEGAVKKLTPIYETYNYGSFEEWDAMFAVHAGPWLYVGSDHKIEDCRISRVVGEATKWFVKISNLKQMTKFVEKYGEIILNNGSITIYDDYVE